MYKIAINHTNFMIFFKTILIGIVSSGVILAGTLTALPVLADQETAVLKTYADIAEATYEDALITAKVLQKAIKTLVSNPTDANLQTAKTAWIASRVAYQQTEAYRFGNAIVDDW